MKMGLEDFDEIVEIGRGGFGRVFKAKYVPLDEPVCLKQNITPDKDLGEMLRMEAKLLWKLNEHHSIPSTKQFFETEKNSYVLALSYIDGKTLQETVEDAS